MPHAIEETGEMSSLNNNNSTISNDSNSSVSTPSSVASSPLSSASLNTNNVVDQIEHANSFICCTERLQNIPDVLEHIDTHHPGFINDREYGMLSVNANTTYSQFHGIPISFPNNRNHGVSGNGYLTNGKKILVSEGNSMSDFFHSQLQFQSLLDDNDLNSNYIHGLRDPNDPTVASLILGNYLSIPGSLENDPLMIGSLQYNDDNNNHYTTASSPSSSDHSSISGSLEDDSLFFGGTFHSNDDINNVSSSSSSQPSVITSSSSSSSNNNDITSASATYSPTSNNNHISSSTYSPVSNNNYSSQTSSSAATLVNNNAAKYIPNNILSANSTTYVNPIITTGNSTTITSSSPTTASSLVNNNNGNTNVINQTAATYNNTTNTQYSANYALYYNVPSVCTSNNGAVDYASRYPRIQPKTSITLADICVDPSKSSKKRSTTTSSFLEDDRYNNKRRIARINEISTTMVGGVLPVPSMIVNKSFSSQSEDKYPYKCAIPGCPKAYKNANGLKYHNEHGHVEQNDNGRSKPFPCRVTGCNKSYGSKGGLIYHINHSHPQEVWALP